MGREAVYPPARQTLLVFPWLADTACAGVTEATTLPFGWREITHLSPSASDYSLNHHLSYPLAALDDDRCLPQINRDQLNLTAIVGVNGSRAVNKGQSLLESETAARANLGFESNGQGDGNTGRYESSFERRQA